MKTQVNKKISKTASVFSLFFLLSFLGTSLSYASVDPVCNVFSNVLQTRLEGTNISVNSGTLSNIYDTPSCTLNTGYVYQDDYNHGLKCDDGTFATASGSYGAVLDINYDFSVETSSVDSTPASGFGPFKPSDETIDQADENLLKSDYDTIEQDYNHYNFTLSYNGDKNINKFQSILNNITIENLDNHDLSIGTFETEAYGSTNIIFEGTADNIYIYDFENSGSNSLYIQNFEAKESIKINTFKLASASSTGVTLRAPKVVIDNLDSANDNNTITIYANEIDIGDITLSQNTQLIIHPYTEGSDIVFHSNSISSSSSSTMIIDSGSYYTKSFSIPGSSDVSSIKASDNSQLINFYIDGDFKPGNNPGINSDGNNGNFGSLSPLNFLLFINGDLETGGGGTTFNATVYVEGSSDLGSPTYLRGALSSYKSISIGNDSKFYYSQDINSSGWGECVSGGSYDFQNNYSCGIMPTVLTSYKSITTQQNDIYNTCTISVKDYSLTEDSKQPVVCYEDATSGTLCSCDPATSECSTNNTCTIIPEPKNKLDYTVYETTLTDTNTINGDMTFTDEEYGSYTFTKHGADIRFEPSETYSDNSTKLMLLGDFKFSDNDQTLTFDGGDYYFNSFKIDRDTTNGNINQVNICAKEDIRIFVKNDFVYSGNHLNDAGCEGSIFIYTEGDAQIDANGGGSSTVPIFIYTEGNVSIENSGDSNDWYGAITAEGEIDVSGKNINFVYDDGASDFGYGECQICYSDILIGGMNINFMGCAGISFMSDIRVPIYTTDTLNNVTVDEVHDETLFSFSFMSTNDVIDQNGTHIADAIVTDSGWDNGAMGMDVSLFNGKAITYPLGTTYGPADTGNGYYQLHSSSLFSFGFNPCDWESSLNYVAHYEDSSGRHYDIQLSPCTATAIASVPAYTTGPFDAWDTDKNISNRVIETKIVNLDFNLTIASIDKTNSLTETKDGVDIQYQLYNDDASNDQNITPWFDYNASASKEITKNFNIDSAYKNTRVKFKVCADYNGTAYILYSDRNCTSNCTSDTQITDSAPCYRYFKSSDNFAIRPKKFEITNIPADIKAGNNFIVTIQALDNNNQRTKDYNETLHINNTSPYIEYNETKTGCVKGTLSSLGSLDFVNGEANITLNYNEVGDINLTIKEDNDSASFAYKDIDDTNIANLLITKTTKSLVILPDHFNINATFKDFGNNFTYISKDLNMSALLDINVTAKSGTNTTTQNYNRACYAKNTDYNISYENLSIVPAGSLTKILYLETNSSRDGNSTINSDIILTSVSRNVFSTEHNGTAVLKFKINFDRNKIKYVNPFKLNIQDINVSDTNGTKGALNLNKSTTFYYGRVHAPDYRFDTNNTSAAIYYEVYCEDCNKTGYNITGKESIDSIYWYNNPLHANYNDGIYNKLAPISKDAKVTISNIQLKSLQLSAITVPCRDKIILTPSSWLVYDRFNPNATTTNFLVEFFKANDKWAGKGKQGKTLDLNISKIQNRRLDW